MDPFFLCIGLKCRLIDGVAREKRKQSDLETGGRAEEERIGLFV